MDVKTLSLQDRLMSRFLRYAAVSTQSKSGTGAIPSTPGQWDLARLLMQDIAEFPPGSRKVMLPCLLSAG